MKKVKNCGNCRWWEKTYEGYTCSLMDSDNGTAASPESQAIAYDSESYHAWVKTEESFYCSQWTEEGQHAKSSS